MAAIAAALCGALLAPGESWAAFGGLSGIVSVTAGDNAAQSSPIALGSTLKFDADANAAGVHQAVARLIAGRTETQFSFSAEASSVSSMAAPSGQNAQGTVLFNQSLTTAGPQWFDLAARVLGPPTDPDVVSQLSLVRAGQATPLFQLSDTGGAIATRGGVFPAGSYTLQGTIATAAVTAGDHSGKIEGLLAIASWGDFNADGIVGPADLAVIRAGFGSGAGTFASGNLDGDADTDGNDFILWQRQLGSQLPASTGGAVVPEPAVAGMLAAAALAAGPYCRTRRSAARRAAESPAR